MASLSSKLERRWRDWRSRVAVAPDRLCVMHSQVGGFHLLVRANEDVGRAIHFTRDFEAAETAFVARILRHDATCLDVGANIGYFTVLMAGLAPQGQVHAFEPLPTNAALLHASITMNGFDNVTLNCAAVGDKAGEVAFTQASDSAYSSMHDTGRKPVARTLSVPMITLDDYCSDKGVGVVDLLKCDVEGAEGLVLNGAQALLSSPDRQPAIILIELHQPNLDLFGTKVSTLMETLAGFGYRAHTLSENGRLIAHDPASGSRHYNFVFSAPRVEGRLG